MATDDRRPTTTSRVVLLVIVAMAAVLRTWHLDTVPLGLHNDEAWTGLTAREVLRDGYVGPYLYPSGLGQPAGPAYFTALLFTVLPQTTFTLRLSMALLGIAAVAFTYAAGRAMFDRTVGLFAAAVLAIMPWHLHLSRTGFMVSSWPAIEMAALWAFFAARARPSVWAYAGVGALIGLGAYTYNAYALFIPVVAVPFLYDLIAARDPRAQRGWVVRTAVATITAAWAATLMIDYAAHHQEYFWHFRGVSLLHSKPWDEATWQERSDILTARAAEWGKGVVFGGRPDDGDALGEIGHPLLDPLTTIAALVGLLMAVRNWRRPASAVLLAAALLLPLGALLTIQDGLYRRTFGLTPFVALLAALPLRWLWQKALRWGGARRALLQGVIVVLLCTAAVRNVYAYFGPLQHGQKIHSVYPYQIDAAARAVARLPAGTTAYLYSERWGARFETIRWLAPDATLLDRSREFRRDIAREAPLDLSAPAEGTVAFVLLGNYLGVTDELRERYPAAVVSEETRDGEVLYRVVFVRKD